MSAHPELTLFYSPRACSLSCHIALEELELPFTAHEVKIRAGEHKEDDYRRVNAWGKISSASRWRSSADGSACYPDVYR